MKGGEKISDLRAAHPGKICNRPLDIQVPTRDSCLVILGKTVDLGHSCHLSHVAAVALIVHRWPETSIPSLQAHGWLQPLAGELQGQVLS